MCIVIQYSYILFCMFRQFFIYKAIKKAHNFITNNININVSIFIALLKMLI